MSSNIRDRSRSRSSASRERSNSRSECPPAGVWVDRDLSWLVSPQQARSLERRIDGAQVPVRVAVLPQVAADESRGDPQSIARAIIRRAGGDGLYVLVDQDGEVEYAARRLPLDLSEQSFPTGPNFRTLPLREAFAALVPTVRAASPAAAVSFLPFADPKDPPGLSTPGAGEQHDALPPIALVFAILGGLGGLGLSLLLRSVVKAMDESRSRHHV